MKKLVVVLVILFLVVFGATTYLNKVFFPKKVKALVVSALAKQTGKNVSLKSLEFNIFRGFILRDLVISDGEIVILSTRQATCAVFIWPIFKKQIIIPSINLRTPYIFLERGADNRFNLQDLFIQPDLNVKKPDFNVVVFKFTINDGDLVFQDNTLANPFKKEIKNIRLNLQLGLPVKFKFNFSGKLLGQSPVSINASGEYKIFSREFVGNFIFKNLSTREFSPYYSNLGDLVSGLIDLQAKVNLKNKLLQVDLVFSGNDLTLVKDSLRAKLDSNLQSKINYNLETKELDFQGACDIWQADLTGLGFLGQVKNLNGRFVFNQRSLVADSLNVELMGLPFKINLGIKDFSTPVLNINTDLDLSILPAVAKEKFNFPLINSAVGRASLSIKLHPDNKGAWVVRGDLKVENAGLKLDKINGPIENISGVLGFSQGGLNWVDTKFKYQGLDYETSGTLFDFSKPRIKLQLYSDDLSVNGDLELSENKIKVDQFKGKYLNSEFSVSGDIDRTEPAKPWLDLAGSLNLNLSDLNKLLGKIYPEIKKFSPVGQLATQFEFRGSPVDFKGCYLQAKSTSNNLSLYGLKSTELSLDYLQEQRIAKISALRMAFYDGLIEGSGALNLDTPEFVYWLELKAGGIRLEKLKLDTPARNSDIGGNFSGQVKLNGAGNDLNKLNAAGNLTVKEGKLGGLNLLKGLGKFLLTKDLGKIEFTECGCDFLLKDKFIFTDKFKLVSEIANLIGPVKIGFDGSLEGALDVQILDEMIPLSGTFQDVTTAIIGKGGKFGVIKLGGTLKEPKYSFKTALGNIMQGLTDVIFKK